MNGNDQRKPAETWPPKALQGFVVLLVLLAILGGAIAGIFTLGERQVINGLLQEGYRVTVNRSLEAGEGRYRIQVREPGLGWVPLYR